MKLLTDDDPIPIGKYSGKLLKDVPDLYLYNLYTNFKDVKRASKLEPVFQYIVENLEAIKKNIEQNKKLFKDE